MKSLKILIYTTLIILFGIACSEEFLEKDPKGVVFPESLNTKEGVDNLLIGAYRLLNGWGSLSSYMQIQASAASIREWPWDCASDDAYKASSAGDVAPMGEIERFEALPTNSVISGRWMVLYDGVSRSNDVLKTLEAVKDDISMDDYNVIAAQARFLRAFYHFRLQKTFFQIPYITHDVEDPASVPNDHQVWPEIEEDLQFAIDHLPESFPGEPGRATKWAATATKAYVHLFQEEYSESKDLLDDIIVSGQFAIPSS